MTSLYSYNPPVQVVLGAGSRVGPYEIQSSLGAGGMGEVYRARDTKLNRDVALKVLPEAFTKDLDRLARFKREAQVLASLNHPNIAAIHGFEDSTDIDALVLELVEGPTLADRIARAAVPLDEALAIARQIADALEAAHEQGIIHRDLKPANIKLRADGVVKVLDFGLAKALDPTSAAPGSDPVHSPTQLPTISSPAMTRVGVILGTAAYMAPEQARGKAVDKRADIWAFGVVLYELVTGRKAFDGEDVTETLAKVIQSEPQWDDVPASVRRPLKRCLEKDPRKRLRDIGDVWTLLDETPAVDVRPVPGRGASFVAWATSAALAVALGIALWAPWRGAPRLPERPLIRLDVDLGPGISLPGLTAPTSSPQMAVVLSPDGTRVAYVASEGGGQERLFVRRLDQPKAVELPGTEGARAPFFSPDSRWLGFFHPNGLFKISVEGGGAIRLADAGAAGADWAGDEIVFGGVNKGLVRVPVTGGAPTAVTEIVGDELQHADPQVLPGGKAVLFTAYGRQPTADSARLEVVSLADHRRKTLVRGGTSARYLVAGDGTGYLVYTNKSTLFAIPFDVDRLETQGAALPILDDVAFHRTGETPQIDVSHDTLIYRRRGGAGSSGLVTAQWVDAAGRRTPVPARPGAYRVLRISPDGHSLALIEAGSNPGVWVYDQPRETTRQLTSGNGILTSLAWTRDGRCVVYGTVGTGTFWTRADGATQPQTLLSNKAIHLPWSFSPDGRRLGYTENQTRPQLWTVSVEETSGQLKAGTPERFLESQSAEIGPVFSPDGRWVAYSSVASGTSETYVRPFPPPASGQSGQWQVSNSGGAEPLWSPNGRDLLYRRGDQIMAVGYTVKGDAFVADKPRVWIAKLGGDNWDLAPDGKRVAVLTPVETDAPKADHTVVLLLNFADELRRRVPIK
jgi:serine/threonine-protein kinase